MDSHYYKPEFVELEKKISRKKYSLLKDYILSISSGATPSRKEDNELYADKSTGVPFLRVQNITEEGLKLDDVKYITKSVHSKYLKRSQLVPNGLLVTITGRIASSCVVPEGFEGNINQHSVIIKTQGKEVSEMIATFLNSNIGQKLALRRASGGSRPALDYAAINSIPIITNEKVVEIMDKAYAIKREKEAEANRLLDSIDGYVLDRLGIELPQPQAEKTFTVYVDELENSRADVYYHKPFFDRNIECIENGSYPTSIIKSVLSSGLIKGKLPNQREKGGKNAVIQISAIDKAGNISLSRLLTAKDIFFENQRLYKDDILLVITGATIGKTAIWGEEKGSYFMGGDIVKITTNNDAMPYFLYFLLSTKPLQIQIKRAITGATNGHLAPRDIENFIIPLPPLAVQNQIAQAVQSRMNQAQRLKKEAVKAVAEAKEQVDRILFV